MTALDRWAGWAGAAIATSSMGLVALADFGVFRLWAACIVIVACSTGSACLWRPPLRVSRPRQPMQLLLALLILGGGAVLIAPGSENVVGSRDPAVYVATGFALARGGSTTVHDPTLQLLMDTVEPRQVNAWLYENSLNHARIRFPTQLFVRDLGAGTVEGGFLPVLPAWIALAVDLGGMEPALHVTGVFGVLALAFAMLACAAAANALKPDEKGRHIRPIWAIAGAILAVAFSQVWWAREAMAEPVLGAFTWLVGWASISWLTQGGWRWALLASLGAVAALFTRADGILVAGVLGLLPLLFPVRDRVLTWAVLAGGLLLAGLHYVLVAPIYMSTTYGAFTLGRAIGGVVAAVVLLGALLLLRWASSWRQGRRWIDRARKLGVWIRQGVALILVVGGGVSALTGMAPGVGRASTAGAASPLAWLPGYVPWPILLLAAFGLLVLAWRGAPQPLAPVLLLGGVPALLYLPDPLVTGDHPWMVRRLVPAVIPLIAILASVGVGALLDARTRLPRIQALAQLAAVILLGFGFARFAIQDRTLLPPRHASGAVAGLREIAASLPSDAILIFPSGSAGVHLATALGYDFGLGTFAIPMANITPPLADEIGRMEAAGRVIYWAADPVRPPTLPPGTTASQVATVRVRYKSADAGAVPPPLQLTVVDDVITLYRIDVGSAASPQRDD